MEFLFSLVKGQAQNEVYGSWYTDEGYILGVIIAAAVALTLVLLFYYLWAKLRPVTTLHWLISMVVSAGAVFGINFAFAKGRLMSYIPANMLDQADPTAIQRIAAGTLDMWLYCVNSLIIEVILFFLFSLVLKRWSNAFNIPFGVSRKK